MQRVHVVLMSGQQHTSAIVGLSCIILTAPLAACRWTTLHHSWSVMSVYRPFLKIGLDICFLDTMIGCVVNEDD